MRGGGGDRSEQQDPEYARVVKEVRAPGAK
jgi:hypothetical protein